MMTLLLVIGLFSFGLCSAWVLMIVVGPAIVRRRRRAVLELMDPVRPVRPRISYSTQREILFESRRLSREFPAIKERFEK